MNAPICWLNGALLPSQQACIDPSDRGFTLGDGVFETIAVRQGGAMHLGRHFDRLTRGAEVLGIDVPWSRATIRQAATDVIRATGQSMGSLRITLTRGPSDRALLPVKTLPPTLLVNWSDHLPRPPSIDAIVSRNTRRNDASLLSSIKSLNYLDSIFAVMEAERAGAQDAVLLNTVGRVTGSASANVIALRAGKLFTPCLPDGALPGIARSLLIERAGVIEASLTPGELHTAEAVILTSSLWIRQVRNLEDTAFSPAPALLTHLRRTAEMP